MATTDLRTAEVQQAQQNPNIFSALSGAPTQSDRMVPPPQFAAEVQKPVQDLSSKLYSSGFVPAAEQTRENALREMFNYDRMLESGQSPFPTVQGYVENPADLYRAGASFSSGLGGVAGAAGGAVSSTEKAYQTATSSFLDKLVDYLTLQENRRQKEIDVEEKKREREEKRKQQQFENELALAKITGGKVTDPNTGKTYSVPVGGGEGTAGERLASQQKGAVIADVQSGMTATDLFSKYAGAMDFNTLQTLYNQNSPYGPAKESMATLRQLYETAGGALINKKVEEKQTTNPVTQEVVNLIDELLERDTKPITGVLQVGPNLPGNPAVYTSSLFDQLRGKLSLENRKLLKGSGAISDYEAKTLESASSALKRGMNNEDLRNELIKLKLGLQTGTNTTGNSTLDTVTGTNIRVRDRASGVTGTIPAAEFDPNLYEKI